MSNQDLGVFSRRPCQNKSRYRTTDEDIRGALSEASQDHRSPIQENVVVRSYSISESTLITEIFSALRPVFLTIYGFPFTFNHRLYYIASRQRISEFPVFRMGILSDGPLNEH
jgi:hypothetical protein